MPELTPGKSTVETSEIAVSQLVQGASDAALAIDDHHHIVAWNHSAERLLGYSADEVIGQRCADVLQAIMPGGEPMCGPHCDLYSCFRDCNPAGVPDCRVRCKNGGWVNISYSSMVMPEQKKDSISGAVVAVIFLHNNEEELQQDPRNGLLQIFMLGKFCVVANEKDIAIEKWKRRQAVTLLKVLAAHLDRPVHRERILDYLWPDVDEERGWGRLKVTMYYLRTQLRASGADEDTVQTVGSAYLLRRDAVWMDSENFEKLVTKGRVLQDKNRYEEAVHCYDEAQCLYRGDYLEQDVYDDWCAEERVRLGEIYMEMMTRKAECHAELNEFDKAVEVCRKGLVKDSCRESLHRSLMKYLAHLGRVDSAIAQFRQCQTVLKREFGVEPMPETKNLHQQTLAQRNSQSSAPAVIRIAR